MQRCVSQPKHIVPHDPGFVLLTDDNWYKTHEFPQNYDASKTVELYAKLPPDGMKKQAELAQKQSGDQESGDKRGHSPDGSDDNQKRSERLELFDDFLVVRDDSTNTTRRLSEEDMERNVQITQCADRNCVKEREQVGDQPGFVFVPGAGPPSKPFRNPAANPTGSTLSTFLVATSSGESLEQSFAGFDGPKRTGTVEE